MMDDIPKKSQLITYILSQNYTEEGFKKLISTVFSEKINVFQEIKNEIIKTNDHKVRNSLAIALSDLGDRKAIPVLADLLKSPKTKGARGTLVYAMQNFNPIEYLSLLVELVITGGVEVEGEALEIIEELEGTIDEETIDICKQKLEKSMTKSQNKEKLETINYLYDMFLDQSD